VPHRSLVFEGEYASSMYCMISTGCSNDQHIYRLTLKLYFSTKKCVHAFALFELIRLKPMNRSVISLLK
jgi:hypothetical protein